MQHRLRWGWVLALLLFQTLEIHAKAEDSACASGLISGLPLAADRTEWVYPDGVEGTLLTALPANTPSRIQVRHADGTIRDVATTLRFEFLEEVLQIQCVELETQGQRLLKGLKQARQRSLEAEAAAAAPFIPDRDGLERDGDGIPELAFFQKYRDVLLAMQREGAPSILRKHPNRILRQLKDQVKTIAWREMDTAFAAYRKTLRSQLGTVAARAHANAIATGDLTALVDIPTQWGQPIRLEYVDRMLALCRVPEGELLSDIAEMVLEMRAGAFANPIQVSSSGATLDIPTQKLRVSFEPDLSTFRLRLLEPRPETNYAFRFFLAHGAATFTSNASGYSSAIPLFHNHRIEAEAFNLPGAMGHLGITPLSLPTGAPLDVQAMARYLTELHRRTGVRNNHSSEFSPSAPLVTFGRSFGSTLEFSHAVSHYLAGDASEVETYILTSFSNPFTLEAQKESVLALEGVTIVPGSIEQIETFSRGLVEVMDAALAKDNGALSQFGDELFFIQGEADADGGPDVVATLETFQKKYAPRAHIYVLPDPWKGRTLPAGFDPDQREASHFVLSTHPNVTPHSATGPLKDFPPELLPQFSDQTKEVLGLLYLAQDYLIDLSPHTVPAIRDARRIRREAFTGGTGKFAYFRWFLQNLNHSPGRSDTPITLEFITSNAVAPGRLNLESRFKRAWNFVHEEAGRVAR